MGFGTVSPKYGILLKLLGIVTNCLIKNRFGRRDLSWKVWEGYLNE